MLGYNTDSSTHFTANEEIVGEDGLWDDGPSGYEWKSRVLKERRAMALDYLGDVRKRVPIHNAVRIRARMNRERLLKDIANSPYDYHKDIGKEPRSASEEEDAAVQGNTWDPSGGSVGPRLVVNDDSPAAILTESLRASHYNPAIDLHAPLESDTEAKARLAVAAQYDDLTRSMLDESLRVGVGGAPLSAAEQIVKGQRAVKDAIDLVEEELEDLLADEGVLETLASIPPSHIKELRHEFFGGAPEVLGSHKDSTDEMLRQWLKLRKESSQYHSFTSVPADERRDWSAWYLRDINSVRKGEDN